MKKIIFKTNVMTIILVVITIISVTTAILSLINQNRLSDVIKMQDAKIGELIKIKKDLLFSKEVNNDTSITSLAELKKMVEDLRTNQYKSDSNDVLGIATSGVGMVTINSGVSTVSIYDSPSNSGSVLSDAIPSPSIMFYYQKQPSWHQVEYAANQLGWISDEVITEVTQ